MSMQPDDHSSTSPLRAVRNERYLQWGPLTDDATEKGINEDISSVTTTPPDSRRHQQILQQLRDRLLELGFAPEYNGFVDCKTSCESGDVYSSKNPRPSLGARWEYSTVAYATSLMASFDASRE
jgi:hypothetical protein